MENENLKRKLVGAGLVTVGLLLLSQQLGYMPDLIEHYILKWQMILIALGTIGLITKPNKFGSLILLVVGVLFYIPEVFAIPHGYHHLLVPIIIVLVGIRIIFRHRSFCNHKVHNCCTNKEA